MGNHNKTQVSVTAGTFAKIRAVADAEGVTDATIVERAIASTIGITPTTKRKPKSRLSR